MNKSHRLLLVLLLCLFGCSRTPQNHNLNQNETNNNTENTDMFTDRDTRITYDDSQAISIEFNGDTISCDSSHVSISGSIVTIKKEGTYIVSGTLNDGMIIVDTDDNAKLQIVLNNVHITSQTSSPLYILSADKVFVTLADHSINTLTNGGEYIAIDDNNIDAVVFSKDDLTLNGKGTLTIQSPAGHGIVGKDDLVFTGGNYEINASGHGLQANDSIRLKDTTMNITSGKDGIHSENDEDTTLGFVYIASGNYRIDAQGDGISANSDLTIEDGIFDIITGGGSENSTKQTSDTWGGFMGGRGPQQTTSEDSTSSKGIKATTALKINNGTFKINSADDTLHSNDSIMINQGTFELNSGDDGMHADNSLQINDGTMMIHESYEGLEALEIEICGGNIDITSRDDGLNAAGGNDQSGMGGNRGNDQFGRPGKITSSSNGSIKISDGNLLVYASGDGIDANGTLEIAGGNTIVYGPTMGDTAVLDYDQEAIITGGSFIGVGANMMAQTFSDSGQGVIALSVGNQKANTIIKVEDEDSNVLMQYEPLLDYQIVIVSCEEMEKGKSYIVHIGNYSESFEAY